VGVHGPAALDGRALREVADEDDAEAAEELVRARTTQSQSRFRGRRWRATAEAVAVEDRDATSCIGDRKGESAEEGRWRAPVGVSPEGGRSRSAGGEGGSRGRGPFSSSASVVPAGATCTKRELRTRAWSRSSELSGLA